MYPDYAAQQDPNPRPKSVSKPRLTPWLIVGGMLAMVALMIVVIVGLLVLAAGQKDKLPDDVQIAGVAVGGKSLTAASNAVNNADLVGRTVTMTDGDRSWTLTLSQMGIGIDTEATIATAQDAPPGTNVQPWYTIDLAQTQQALIYLSELANVTAVPGQDGRSLEIPVMLDRLRVDPTGELADGALELNMIVVPAPEPETTTDYDGPTTTHVVERGQELALIAREYGVTTADIVALNGLANPDLLFIGQELLIPAAGAYEPPAPAAPTATGRAILVSVSQQRIYAFENGEMVHSHLTSTGLPETPTVLGDYRIQRKYVATDMRGEDYFLPDVPWTMYFYQGYAIHGTYWHNSFGRPMSHGCVNLPPEEAQWFYEFADMGTLVRVVS